MKVVGTGAPVVLTVRFERCELDVLRDELHHVRAGVTESAAVAHQRATDPGAGAGSAAVESNHQRLVELSALLDQVELLDPEEEEPLEVAGPSAFFASVIRGAATEAAERYADAMRRFRDPDEHCSREELRAAAEAARAWTETLLGYDFVENHGMRRWG